eukprot:960044-Rhodomonas_salina.1
MSHVWYSHGKGKGGLGAMSGPRAVLTLRARSQRVVCPMWGADIAYSCVVALRRACSRPVLTCGMG